MSNILFPCSWYYLNCNFVHLSCIHLFDFSFYDLVDNTAVISTRPEKVRKDRIDKKKDIWDREKTQPTHLHLSQAQLALSC